MQTVTLLLDRGTKGAARYEVSIPATDLFEALPPELKEVIGRYVYISLYNRFHTIGAEHLYIDAPKSIFDFIQSELFPSQEDEFHSEHRPNGQPRSPSDYFGDVYETVFTVEQKSLEAINTLQSERPQASVTEQKAINLEGAFVGLDVGKSDVKAAFVYNGKVLASVEEKWNAAAGEPEKITNPERHFEMLSQLVQRALEEGSAKVREEDPSFVDHIDGIGLAWNGAVNNNRIRGRFAPVVKGLDKADFEAEIAPMATKLEKKFEVSVAVLNDGDAGALLVAVDKNAHNVLAWSLGSGLASGYVDAQGNVTDYLTEMGNVVTDMTSSALRHSVTGMPGAIQRTLSQRYVLHYAAQLGIPLDLEASGEPVQSAKNLETVQEIYSHGAPHEQALVRQIFIQLGQELAVAIQEVHAYLPIENVVLFGRVMTGEPGDLIVEEAKRVLKKQAPQLANHITIEKIDEDLVRGGQAVGAAYYAAQMRQPPEDNHPAGTLETPKGPATGGGRSTVKGIVHSAMFTPSPALLLLFGVAWISLPPVAFLVLLVLGAIALLAYYRGYFGPKGPTSSASMGRLIDSLPSSSDAPPTAYHHGQDLNDVLAGSSEVPSVAEVQSAEKKLGWREFVTAA